MRKKEIIKLLQDVRDCHINMSNRVAANVKNFTIAEQVQKCKQDAYAFNMVGHVLGNILSEIKNKKLD